jgi:DNA-binding transcriptional ArsR family regulator
MNAHRAAAVLSALAQPTRLSVFRALVAAGPVGRSAGALARAARVVPATLSFHLKALTHAGLIEARREGRNIIYAVNTARMRALLEFLALDCCDGNPEICGIALQGMSSRKRARTRKARAHRGALVT